MEQAEHKKIEIWMKNQLTIFTKTTCEHKVQTITATLNKQYEIQMQQHAKELEDATKPDFASSQSSKPDEKKHDLEKQKKLDELKAKFEKDKLVFERKDYISFNENDPEYIKALDDWKKQYMATHEPTRNAATENLKN